MHVTLELLFLPLLMQLHSHSVLIKFFSCNLLVPSDSILSGLLSKIVALLNDLKHSWVVGIHFNARPDYVLLRLIAHVALLSVFLSIAFTRNLNFAQKLTLLALSRTEACSPN